MSSAAPPGWVAERSHRRSTPDTRTLEGSPGWRPLQRGVRRPATSEPKEFCSTTEEVAPEGSGGEQEDVLDLEARDRSEFVVVDVESCGIGAIEGSDRCWGRIVR